MQSPGEAGLRTRVRTLHPTRLLCVLMLSVGLSSQAIAADPSANIVIKIFIDACVPNMGRPDQVRAWATDKHLAPVTADAALAVFVGPGTHGNAWAVPSNAGSFALSIRGITQACAVWARAADPGEVEALYKKLILGAAQPGLEITTILGKSDPTPAGQARSLVYHLKAQGASSGFVFTMLTAEHAGSAFQASLQVAKSTGE